MFAIFKIMFPISCGRLTPLQENGCKIDQKLTLKCPNWQVLLKTRVFCHYAYTWWVLSSSSQYFDKIYSVELKIRFLLIFIIILLAMSSKANVDFHFTCSSHGQLRHKIIPKIDAKKFGILLAFFAEYNINYFSKLMKSKKFLLLTRILLTA
jgi:hypothetical protein